MRELAALTSTELAALIAAGPVVVLVPCGSVEPHGPHLPLATDTIISQGAIAAAATRLAPRATVLVAPAVAYGVTEYARAFAGAVSIPAATLTAYLHAIVTALLDDGVAHVCLVNNHLEPAHDAAVRAAAAGLDPRRASVACPLERRWARRLTDEFKRGECHAGRYETSLMLAAGHAVTAGALPAVPVSLSAQIQAGVTEFVAMGLTDGYAGAPAEATREEGRATYEILGEMIATTVLQAIDAVGANEATETT